MPKPVFKALLGFLFLSFVVVACNNKKKEGDGNEKKEPTEKMDPAPTPAPSNDTPLMKKDSMPVVPDNKTVPPPPGN